MSAPGIQSFDLPTSLVSSQLTSFLCFGLYPISTVRGNQFDHLHTGASVRSDNGSEFIGKMIRTWLQDLGAKTLCIEPASPWKNRYIESFNGKLRVELLNREIFYT